MRTIIYGAGAVGGVIGGCLARAGQDVLLIGHAGHIKAINDRGLRLITPAGEYTVRVPTATSISQIDFRPGDVIFLCVKGQDTDYTLQNLRSATPEVPVFCFQNGVRNEETASKYFPRVYGVMVKAWMVYLTDGEVTAMEDPPGKLAIGRYPRGTDELAEAVASVLRNAGFSVLVTPDVMLYKWGKLIDNLGNAVGAITNGQGKDVDHIVAAAQQEFQGILSKAGICWKSIIEPAEEWPEMTLPPRNMLESEALTSTWMSLSRRRGSIETEFLNGEVVRLAKRIGQQAPINEALMRISEDMAANRELPGKYKPRELSILLGLKPS